MSGEEGPRRIAQAETDAAIRELTSPKLVRLDRNDTLTFHDAPDYEIDARELDTHRGLLGWLCHLAVSGKRWFTLECLVDLLATLKGRQNREDADRKGQRRK